MHWDGYTTFSVLSGISLIVCALLLPRHAAGAKDRVYALLGGAFFLGYGIYAGHAKSGVFLFPVWIFVLPFGALVLLVASWAQHPNRKGGAR